jgi:hypothetical protein
MSGEGDPEDDEGTDDDAAKPAAGRPALPDLAPQTHPPDRSPAGPAGPVHAEQ